MPAQRDGRTIADKVIFGHLAFGLVASIVGIVVGLVTGNIELWAGAIGAAAICGIPLSIHRYMRSASQEPPENP